MNDLRTKIAAITVALGLGGLGGYAISSSKSSKEVAVAPAAEGTKVIRRTIHAKRHRTKVAGPRHAAAGRALASESVSTGSSGSSSGYSGSSGSPVGTGSSGSSSHSGRSSHRPVHTGSSGSSQSGSSHSPVTTGSSGSGGGATGGGDDGGEVEHEGGD